MNRVPSSRQVKYFLTECSTIMSDYSQFYRRLEARNGFEQGELMENEDEEGLPGLSIVRQVYHLIPRRFLLTLTASCLRENLLFFFFLKKEEDAAFSTPQ